MVSIFTLDSLVLINVVADEGPVLKGPIWATGFT